MPERLGRIRLARIHRYLLKALSRIVSRRREVMSTDVYRASPLLLPNKQDRGVHPNADTCLWPFRRMKGHKPG